MYWFATICLVAVLYVQVDAVLDIEVKKYGYCSGFENTPIKHTATLKKINSSMIMGSGDASVPFDLDKDVTIKIKIDIMKDGAWKEFKTIEQKDPCILFNKYGGDMFFDLEEKVGVARGACPLPKGNYKVTDHMLDFERLPIKTGPTATVRATAQLLKEEEVLLCMEVEAENK